MKSPACRRLPRQKASQRPSGLSGFEVSFSQQSHESWQECFLWPMALSMAKSTSLPGGVVQIRSNQFVEFRCAPHCTGLWKIGLEKPRGSTGNLKKAEQERNRSINEHQFASKATLAFSVGGNLDSAVDRKQGQILKVFQCSQLYPFSS